MDIDFLLWLQGMRNSIGEIIAIYLSTLGSDVLMIAVACIFYWCLNKKNGKQLLLAFSFGAFLNCIVKLSCCVYRPWVRDSRIIPVEKAVGEIASYSFPSAHACAATEMYGGIGYMYRKNKPLFISTVILTALIMFSRTYLGVHTLYDVLVGAALGILTLCAAHFMIKYIYTQENSNNDVTLAIITTLLCAASIIYITLKSYPSYTINGTLLVDPEKMQQDHFTACGAVLGIVWGFVLERRVLNFEPCTSLIINIIRFLFGMFVTLLLYKVVKVWLIALLGTRYGKLSNAFLVMLYVVVLHPILFSVIEKKLSPSKCYKILKKR